MKGLLVMLHVNVRKATLEKYYIHWNKKAACTNDVETTNALDPPHSLEIYPEGKKWPLNLLIQDLFPAFLLTW